MTAEKEQKTFSFVEMEHGILDFWDQESIFQQSLKNTKDKKPYIFYDGPPFATGLPHHGHWSQAQSKMLFLDIGL